MPGPSTSASATRVGGSNSREEAATNAPAPGGRQRMREIVKGFERDTREKQLERWRNKCNLKKAETDGSASMEELYWMKRSEMVEKQMRCIDNFSKFMAGMAMGSLYYGLSQKLAYEPELSAEGNSRPAVSPPFDLNDLQNSLDQIHGVASLRERCNGDIGGEVYGKGGHSK